MATVDLYFDGASKSNPGPSGCGYIIKYQGVGIVINGCEYLGKKTNNEAEYSGLIHGLTKITEMGGIDTVNVYGDSKLIIEQMSGNWKVKAPNLFEYYENARKLVKQIKEVKFKHIDRSLNHEADKLANQAVNSNSNSSTIKF